MPKNAESFSARDAAARYAEDSDFAADFELALQEIYEDHLAALQRIQKRLGGIGPAAETNVAPTPASSAAPKLISPDRVRQVLQESPAGGLTRGDIAARLGIDSRDARLTRVLQALKADRQVYQTGIRRSARYHTDSRPGSGR